MGDAAEPFSPSPVDPSASLLELDPVRGHTNGPGRSPTCVAWSLLLNMLLICTLHSSRVRPISVMADSTLKGREMPSVQRYLCARDSAAREQARLSLGDDDARVLFDRACSSRLCLYLQAWDDLGRDTRECVCVYRHGMSWVGRCAPRPGERRASARLHGQSCTTDRP